MEVPPHIAANLYTLIIKDREDSAFPLTINAFTGRNPSPQEDRRLFIAQDAPDSKERYYSYHNESVDASTEIAIAEFIAAWGASLLEWARIEDARRKQHAQDHLDAEKKRKEKEREKKKKEKAKRAKAGQTTEAEGDEEGEEPDYFEGGDE